MEDAKKGFDLVLLAEAYAKSGAVRSADKSNPTISIQSFLENVNDIEEFVKRIEEFVKRIPVDKILDNSERSNTPDGIKSQEHLWNIELKTAVLYTDSHKKRTNDWLSRTGLQLPVGEKQRGSIRKITYYGGKVKIQNPIHIDSNKKCKKNYIKQA